MPDQTPLTNTRQPNNSHVLYVTPTNHTLQSHADSLTSEQKKEGGSLSDKDSF